MARIILALLGGALVLIGSFFVSLKLFDYFGLFPGSGPDVSLTVNGKDSIVIPGGNYNLAYRTSGVRSCEMVYRNSDDNSSGRYPVPPNIGAAGGSGLIGEYTLTCIGLDGATVSKTVRISHPPK
jgi:hypothetical protein